MPKQWILMTNDDGVESESLLGLGKALADQDLGVVIFAPSDNQSATGMKLNLMKPLPFLLTVLTLKRSGFQTLISSMCIL